MLEKIPTRRATEQEKGSENLSCHETSVEDRDGVQFTRYEYAFQGKKVEIIFKNQEYLTDPLFAEGKDVVFIGDMPYAQTADVVKENMQDLSESADSIVFLHKHGNYTRKFHFGAYIPGAPIRNDFIKPEPSVGTYTDKGVKPATGFLVHEKDRLRESVKEGNTLLVVQENDVASITSAANVVKDILGIERAEKLVDTTDVGHMEDLVATYSFDENGEIAPDKHEEARKLLFESIIGEEKSFERLEQAFTDNETSIFPYHMHNMLRVKEELEAVDPENYLSSARDQIIFFLYTQGVHYEDPPATIKEKKENAQQVIENLIESYRQNNEVIDIPEDVVQELDKHVAIHMTQYYPMFDEKNNEWYVPPHSQATGTRLGRLTTHFAIDGIASAAAITSGDWDEKPFAILTPLGQLVKKNGPMHCFLTADTWWTIDPNSPGIRLPEESTIIASRRRGKNDPAEDEGHTPWRKSSEDYIFEKEKKLKHTSNHRGPDNYIKRMDSSLRKETVIEKVLNEQYGVPMKSIGNEGWTKDRTEEKDLTNKVREAFPFVLNTLHMGAIVEWLEKESLEFFHKVALASNIEKATAVIGEKEMREAKEGNQYERYHEMKMLQENKETPGKVIEMTREKIIQNINQNSSMRLGEGVALPREMARLFVKIGIL